MNDLSEAVKIIKEGGIVIYPTDTAFGIGCRVDREKSLEKLFEIRKRPVDKAMPVLFDSIERVKEYVLPFDSKVEELMSRFWPGALTIILPANTSKVPEQVRGGGLTLGIRIPDHEIMLELIREADVPITGSSANFAGGSTPFTYEALDKSLIKLVDFVVEGKTKEQGLSSTVIDCSVNPWKIVRQGSVDVPDL